MRPRSEGTDGRHGRDGAGRTGPVDFAVFVVPRGADVAGAARQLARQVALAGIPSLQNLMECCHRVALGVGHGAAHGAMQNAAHTPAQGRIGRNCPEGAAAGLAANEGKG